MNWKEISPKVIALKDGILSAMDRIRQMSAQEQQLPKPNVSFDEAERVLRSDNFEVVVCGEVKKGKSSFINALLGRELLPVDSNIATAQIFRISNSDKDKFELVFTDGSKKEITSDELDKYGSQINYNVNGEPQFEGKVIDYIQVNTSAAFLPKGVNLVDTPGLGALYRTHEAITKRYIKKASAVIFVLDFAAPIGEQEQKFIHQVLEVTPYVMFVITKSDYYTNDDRMKIMDRNKEILDDIYKKYGKVAPEILQFSSKKLLESLKNSFGREANLKQSGFERVEEKLLKTIYSSVGLLRTGSALIQSGQLVNQSNKIIADILRSSAAATEAIQRDVENEKRRLQEDFQQDWKSGSRKRRELERSISAKCSSVNVRVRELFAMSGTIWAEADNNIRNINSLDEARVLADSLPSAIAQEISSTWMDISDDILSDIIVSLESIDASIDGVYTSGLTDGYSVTLPSMTTGEKIKTVQSGFIGLSAGSAIGGVIGGLVGTLFGPAGTVAGAQLGALLGGAGGAIAVGNNTNMDVVRANLRTEISRLREKMNNDLISIAQEFSREVQSQAFDAIEDTLEQRKEQLQAELDDIIARGKMDIEEKKNQYKLWLEIQTEWNTMKDGISKLISERQALTTLLN